MNDIICIPTGPFQVNTWILKLCKNFVIVIDPAACRFTHDEQKISSFLKNNNLKPVLFLLTHGHFDHIAGTGILKDLYPDIPLAVHEKDYFMCGQNASSAQNYSLDYFGLNEETSFLNNLPDPDVKITAQTNLAELIKNDDAELKESLEEWKIIHTPGHTEGSICIYNEAKKILFSGDTVFYHSYGRTDLPGGSEQKIAESLRKIYSTIPAETKVFPGHGEAGFELAENL